MRLLLAPLVSLALCLGCIHAYHVPDGEHSHPPPTSELVPPPLPSGITSTYPDLVAYAQAQKAIRDGAPLVTPDVEERLLIDAAEEVKHLDIYDDSQRERLSAIREATRAIIKQRSTLPTPIDPDTDISILKDLAVQFEITFLEHASLSSSSKWAKYCMAALLGKDTLIRLLPLLSDAFVNKHQCSMLQAAAVIGDLATFRAVATHSKLLHSDRQGYSQDALVSGSVDFVRRFADFIPSFISDATFLLDKAIVLNHRSLFEYLYDETIKQRLEQYQLEYRLRGAFVAIAGRGWVDIFEQLHREYPQCLDTKKCLIAAAEHGRIEILKYLLFHEDLGERAKIHLIATFEAAIGSGNIDAIDFLLGKDEIGNPLIPHLSLTQPGPNILDRVSRSGRWEGIDYVMQLKNNRDARFEKFKLTGDASEAVRTACSDGSLGVLRQLLQRDSQGQFVFAFEDPTSLLQTSLLNACEQGHHLIVQEILKYSNVDPAANDNEALDIACWSGHHLVVRELLRDKRVASGAGEGKILIGACERGCHLVVREFLQRRDGQYICNVDPAANDNEALIAACKSGNLLVVRELLQHKGVDPGARNNAPLIAACKVGHLLVVRELLQKRERRYIYNIEPDAQDNEALIAACNAGHLSVVQELLRHEKVNVSARNNEAFIVACRNGGLLVVRELLQHKRVVPGANDNSALIAACENHQWLVVEELLRDKRVNPGARNNYALIAACESGCLPVVQQLLRDNRVDAGAQNGEPLIAACRAGRLQVVQELLRKDNRGKYLYNVDPAARCNQCLIDACNNGHLTVVKFLLQGRPNAHGVIEYEHAGIDAAAQKNRALWTAISCLRHDISEVLLQRTEGGDYLFPGIAITEQMRQIAAHTSNEELQKLLK